MKATKIKRALRVLRRCQENYIDWPIKYHHKNLPARAYPVRPEVWEFTINTIKDLIELADRGLKQDETKHWIGNRFFKDIGFIIFLNKEEKVVVVKLFERDDGEFKFLTVDIMELP